MLIVDPKTAQQKGGNIGSMAPRKSYSPALKAKAVLELLRDDKPLVQVAAE